MDDAPTTEEIDADAIVITLQRGVSMPLSGGVRTVGADGVRVAAIAGDDEPVLAD